MIFAATRVGAYVSDDGGVTWTPTSGGAGRCDVRDLAWIPDSNDLVAATYGCGLWMVTVSPWRSVAG